MSHLSSLRAVQSMSAHMGPLDPVDADLSREAGMDGNLGRLLQAARTLDNAGPLPIPGVYEALTMANARLLVHVVVSIGPRGPAPLDQLRVEEPEWQRVTAVDLADGTSTTTQRDGSCFLTEGQTLAWAVRTLRIAVHEATRVQRDGGYTLLAR